MISYVSKIPSLLVVYCLIGTAICKNFVFERSACMQLQEAKKSSNVEFKSFSSTFNCVRSCKSGCVAVMVAQDNDSVLCAPVSAISNLPSNASGECLSHKYMVEIYIKSTKQIQYGMLDAVTLQQIGKPTKWEREGAVVDVIAGCEAFGCFPCTARSKDWMAGNCALWCSKCKK